MMYAMRGWAIIIRTHYDNGMWADRYYSTPEGPKLFRIREYARQQIRSLKERDTTGPRQSYRAVRALRRVSAIS